MASLSKVKAIDDQFFRVVLLSAQKTFKELTRWDLELLYTGNRVAMPPIDAALCAMIGVTGATNSGGLVLAFPEDVLVQAVNRVMGANYTHIVPEIEDGAAELANIIFSQARARLNTEGYDIRMALPVIMRGKNIQSGFPMSLAASSMFLRVPGGNFIMDFAQRQTPDARLSEGGNGEVPKYDAKVLMSFVDGIRNTLKLQFGIDSKAGAPGVRKRQGAQPFEVAVMVGVTGKGFIGNFSLNFPRSTLFGLLKTMSGLDLNVVNKDVEDSVVELNNIILSQAKQFLNAQGYEVRVSMPAVIVGESVHSSYLVSQSPILLPFQVSSGQFWVEFGFHPTGG